MDGFPPRDDSTASSPRPSWRRRLFATFSRGMGPGGRSGGAALPRVYPYEIRHFRWSEGGVVAYAQWLHPKEREKRLVAGQVDALRGLVSPGDFVVDVGAHTGDSTLPLALAAGPTGLALALEPNPCVFRVLEVNARLNKDKTRIVPLRCAATETDGEHVFHYSDQGYCNGGDLSPFRRARRGHAWSLRVQGRHLGRLLREDYSHWLPRLSLIKVDTEGHDHEVLATVLDILREIRPTILCEVYRHLTRSMREHYFHFLEQAGYACHELAHGAKAAGRRLGEKDFLCRRHFDVLALPREPGRLFASGGNPAPTAARSA